MKFWTTGRIDQKIAFESFQPIMKKVESEINNLLTLQDYGNLIESYDVVINIFEQEPEERFRYSKKNRETDIDVNINHDEFSLSNEVQRFHLYINAVLRSIEGIRNKKDLKGFDFDLFESTIKSLIIPNQN
jgi:Immunity protein 44